MNFRDRIQLKEVFGDYCPNFTYKVVCLHDYTNEELLGREDEMSFLMMINRIQNQDDLRKFLQVEQDKVKKIVNKASPQVLEIFAETIWSLCMKMNVPTKEAEECVNKVKERNMGYLFENMEKMDIQEERRKTADARRELKEAREEAERQAKKLERDVQERLKAAQKQMEEAQSRAEEAQSRVEEAQSRAEEAQSQAEQTRIEAIRNTVQLCQRLGAAKEIAVQELMDTYDMDQMKAQETAAAFWREIK